MPNWALIVCGVLGGMAITLIGLRYLIPFFFKRFALGLFEAKASEDDEDDDDCGKIQGPGKIDISAYVPQGESQLQLHYYTLLVGQPFTVPD